MRHLAIFYPEAAQKIFTGSKKVDLRASKKKIVPYGAVTAGDTVLVKVAGRKVMGKFTVEKTVFYDHPSLADLSKIEKQYRKLIFAPEKFWKNFAEAKFVSLIFIGLAQRLLLPSSWKKRDLRGWVVLG